MNEPSIRQAASAICVREGGGGPEVLVVERSLEPAASFPATSRSPAARWRTPTPSTRSGGSARPRRGSAGRRRPRAARRGRARAERRRGSDRPRDATRSLGCTPHRPSTGQLTEMARWIAPPVGPGPVRRPLLRGRQRGPAPSRSPTAWRHPTPGGSRPAGSSRSGSVGSGSSTGRPTSPCGSSPACRSADDVLALRFETREPNDDEIATLPRSVMEQD